MVTWLSIQYVTRVLPFLFTEVFFQETCLLFKSPTISTESFWAKIWSRFAVERGDDGGWYVATNNSLEVC